MSSLSTYSSRKPHLRPQAVDRFIPVCLVEDACLLLRKAAMLSPSSCISHCGDRRYAEALPRQSGAAFQTDWHQKALTLINELGPLVFWVPQMSFLPRPVRRPQTQPGHKRGCGLYFGEVTQAHLERRFFKPCTIFWLGVQVEKVEAALKDIK